MFPFLPASSYIASTEVSSFEGPIILKKDLQVIEVKYINVHCESVLLTLQ